MAVTMPQMGVSVAEGTVVEWKKRPGDWVQADEPICTISTDKIDTDVEAPASGRLAEVVVDVNETVPVGTLLARIDTDARPGEAHTTERVSEAPEDAAPPPEQVAETGTSEATAALGAPGRAGSLQGDTAEGDGVPTRAPRLRDGGARRYSPVVLRMAQEHGIDVELIEGTGRGGRVRKQDVLAYLRAQEESAGAPEEPAAPEPPMHIESPYRPEPAPAPPPPAPAPGPAPAAERVVEPAPAPAPAPLPSGHREPLSRIRRSIGQHMVRSLATAAHCTTIVEADMSRIAAARGRLKLTYLPFVARCVIETLREFPLLNAWIEGDELVRHDDVNLGVAVSLGENGLIVPVVHRAQELSVEGLGARIRDLAERARAGRLTPDEVRGGTFTITNPGAFGAVMATPIINQPQVAILDLEAVVKRPIVVSDEHGNDAIAIRPMTYVCMSWDHRALDGALAAQFLSALRARIETHAW